MRGWRWAVALAGSAASVGCAALIGASFDDARLPGDGGDGGDGGDPFADVRVPPSDASDAADAGFDAALDPTSLGALNLWFSADEGVTTKDGGGITKWAAHDGGVLAIGTSYLNAADAPTLVPAAQNGLPAVKFVQSKLQYFTTSAPPGPKGKSLSLFVVAKGNPMAALAWGQSFSLPCTIFPWGTAKTSMGMYMYGEYFGQAVSTDTRWALWEVVYKTASIGGSTYFFNGVAGDVVTSVRTDLPETTFYLGGTPFQANAAYYMDGLLGEALVYGEALTDTNRRRLEAHLAQRWGFALGP